MDIMFQTRNDYIFKKINSISKTGKSIHIDHPDLNNSLQIVSRKVYVLENINLDPNLPNLSYPLTDYNHVTNRSHIFHFRCSTMIFRNQYVHTEIHS